MRVLCNPKIKLLKKAINNPDFKKPDELITLDMNFTSQRLHSNLMPKKTVKKATTAPTEEEKKEQQRIEKERTFAVQAHIVKVMKSRKQLQMQHLVSEIMGNIGLFKAEPKMVKEQIEVLISNDYIKRDESDKRSLIYIP